MGGGNCSEALKALQDPAISTSIRASGPHSPRSQPASHAPATNLPDLPPCFSSNFTSVMVMPRSTALHMS